MQIIYNFSEKQIFTTSSVIALGTFDGLHLGHLDVIKTAQKYALEHSLQLLVFTFSNHPLSQIRPNSVPDKLISDDEKERLFNELGVDILVNIPFTEEFAHISPENFLDKLKIFNYQCLVVGENYTYGYMGKGNMQSLRLASLAQGFDLLVRPLVKSDNHIVSSTSIRALIKEGKILSANKLLGRDFTIEGKVVHGAGRGNGLGFPTANIEFVNQDLVVPANGVYAVTVQSAEFTARGMANIGLSPTFGDIKKKRLEVNIFDFNANIYGMKLKVVLNKYIRDEVKFDSIKELLLKMKQDEEEIRKYFEC